MKLLVVLGIPAVSRYHSSSKMIPRYIEFLFLSFFFYEAEVSQSQLWPALDLCAMPHLAVI